MAKEFLKEKGVEYTDIDVSSDQAKAEEMVKLSGQMGVPVIDVDGKIMIGFDKKELAEAVGVEA